MSFCTFRKCNSIRFCSYSNSSKSQLHESFLQIPWDHYIQITLVHRKSLGLPYIWSSTSSTSCSNKPCELKSSYNFLLQITCAICVSIKQLMTTNINWSLKCYLLISHMIKHLRSTHLINHLSHEEVMSKHDLSLSMLNWTSLPRCISEFRPP